MVWVIEALSKETESKQAAWPKSQAPSPDPTSRPVSVGAPAAQVKRKSLGAAKHRAEKGGEI